MDDQQFSQIANKLLDLDKRLTRIEDWISEFSPIRPHNDTADMLYPQAEELVKQHDFASTALLQRRLSIGYARAARILDQLEEKGIVSKGEGAKPRKVLIK